MTARSRGKTGTLLAGLVVVCLAAAMAAAQAARPGESPHDWLEGVRQLPAAARATAIEARIASAGGTPIIGDATVLFLVAHAGASPPRIVGDIMPRDHRVTQDARATAMSRIEGTPWFALELPMLPHGRFTYLVDRGRGLERDPRNPRQLVDGGGVFSEARAADYQMPDEVIDALARGDPFARVEHHHLTGLREPGRHDVFVHRPRGSGPAPLPTVYFLDGSNWIRHGLATTLLDALIERKVIDPLVAVFVDFDAAGRAVASSEAHRTLMDVVIPMIEARYPVSRRPADRGIVASAAAAPQAIAASLSGPSCCGFAALFGPAIPDPGGIPASPDRMPVEFVVVSGVYDARWQAGAGPVAARLRARSRRVMERHVPQGTGFVVWREFLGMALAEFDALEHRQARQR